MAERQIEIHPDLESLSQAAARRVLASARRAAADGRDFCLGLSGGSTPRRLYEILASPRVVDDFPWQLADIFWCDERALPPESSDSNYHLAMSSLLKGGQINAKRIHRMEADAADLEAACDRYQEVLSRVACRADRAPFCLDVALLGMGADGHTASLFPGSSAVGEVQRLVAIFEGGTPRVKRLTLTLPALNRSRDAIFLVSGAEKAGVVAEVLAGNASPIHLPAAGVAPGDGRLLWLLDAAAAAELPTRLPGFQLRRMA